MLSAEEVVILRVHDDEGSAFGIMLGNDWHCSETLLCVERSATLLKVG